MNQRASCTQPAPGDASRYQGPDTEVAVREVGTSRPCPAEARAKVDGTSASGASRTLGGFKSPSVPQNQGAQ